jgi:cation/acetate symporter
MYSVGWLGAYITVLLLIAEPCRNIGRYTLSDILSYRNDPRKTRIVGALSTITVSTFYLTAQMVGGGVLVKTLIGINYEASVICVGLLMLGYVLFGGMVATTWVQIIKAILLVSASIVIVMLVWAPYGFSLPAFLADVVAIRKSGARGDALGVRPSRWQPARTALSGTSLYWAPVDQIANTAGVRHADLPHHSALLHRRRLTARRRSVVWAVVIISGFYVRTRLRCFRASLPVGSAHIAACDAGGNMAGPLLAQFIGGGPDSFLGNFMLAFVSAVAFATIVAVVAGLVLAAASAMAHDLYVGVVRAGKETTAQGVKAARIATAIVGAMSIGIGIAAKGQNVAVLVGLAFAVAASANFPCVLLTLYWKRCNTGGIVAGMLVGTLAAVGLTLVSPNLTYPLAVKAAAHKLLDAAPAKRAAATEASASSDAALAAAGKSELAAIDKAEAKARAELDKWGEQRTSFMGLEKPLFELKNPGLISIPLGFLAVIVGSLLYRDKRAEEMWNEVYARQNTGLLVSRSAGH